MSSPRRHIKKSRFKDVHNNFLLYDIVYNFNIFKLKHWFMLIGKTIVKSQNYILTK